VKKGRKGKGVWFIGLFTFWAVRKKEGGGNFEEKKKKKEREINVTTLFPISGPGGKEGGKGKSRKREKVLFSPWT